jgi:tetratricopeptide (TPR) repeat protein
LLYGSGQVVAGDLRLYVMSLEDDPAAPLMLGRTLVTPTTFDDRFVGGVVAFALEATKRRVVGREAIASAVAGRLAALLKAPPPGLSAESRSTYYLAYSAAEIQSASSSNVEPLRRAAEGYRQALSGLTAERFPSLRGDTQLRLGNVLWSLGREEKGVESVREAVAAYEAALEATPSKTAALAWAQNQANLGTALAAWADREPQPGLLERAVIAFQQALSVFNKDQTPDAWASAQINMGTALAMMSRTEKDEVLLEQAIVALRSALLVLDRQRRPLDWAGAQHELGMDLGELGERRRSAELLRDAAGAYREALKERSFEKTPREWGATQHNLGHVLVGLGQTQSGTTDIEAAIEAFREALKARTQTATPESWAETTYSLAGALVDLSLRDKAHGDALLSEAVELYRATLTMFTPERPGLWARSQNSLGVALAIRGERLKDMGLLIEAKAAMSAALDVRKAQGDSIRNMEANIARLNSVIAGMQLD